MWASVSWSARAPERDGPGKKEQLTDIICFDVPFAMDSKFQARPQMIDSWELSPDDLTWPFRLRDGLAFSHGSPVRSADVVASFKRWGARIVGAQILMSLLANADIINDREFALRFKRKYPPMIKTLANSDQPLFVMRQREAEIDPNKAVTDVIGPGPFLFKKNEWRPGQRSRLCQNPNHKPRSEPADGYAGGKVVHLDRVEWLYTPDPGTAAQALIANEVDVYELPPNDLLPLLEAARNVRTAITNRLGSEAIMRPNCLITPTDNPLVRQAMLYAVDQQAALASITGNPSLGKPCWEVFICGTPLGVTAGLGDFAKPAANPAKAKSMLRQAGYKGERIVMMNPTDQALVTALVTVDAAKLREGGFNVEVQNTDCATMISRRSTRLPPDQSPNGWHIFHTWSPGTFWADPLENNAIATQCDGSNWFGWPCDKELRLRSSIFC